MKPSIKLVLSFLFLFSSILGAQDKHLLSGATNADQLRRIILSSKSWHPFPKHSERGEWLRINESLRKAYIAQAEP